MRRIYVAGPYSAATDAGVQANIDMAHAHAQHLVNLGWNVFTPHKNSAHFVGQPQEFWYLADLEWLEICHAIYMLPHWELSKGARYELEYARSRGIEIFYAKDGFPVPDDN